jgi:hypothetical protein
MNRKRKNYGIRRCKSCGEIIRIDGEWMPGCNRISCASCRYIEEACNPYQLLEKCMSDLIMEPDFDEYDTEMIGDPDIDLEEYLQ